jgi:hypothetical protein
VGSRVAVRVGAGVGVAVGCGVGASAWQAVVRHKMMTKSIYEKRRMTVLYMRAWW